MKETKVRRGCVVRSLLVMYIISGLLLVLLALIVSRVEKEDAVAQVGVIVIYVLSCGIGGFVLGKWKKRQKFLWGLLVGILYVATLLGAALWIQERKPAAHPLYGNCICHLHRIGNAGRYAELRKQKKCFSFRHLYAII